MEPEGRLLWKFFCHCDPRLRQWRGPGNDENLFRNLTTREKCVSCVTKHFQFFDGKLPCGPGWWLLRPALLGGWRTSPFKILIEVSDNCDLVDRIISPMKQMIQSTDNTPKSQSHRRRSGTCWHTGEVDLSRVQSPRNFWIIYENYNRRIWIKKKFPNMKWCENSRWTWGNCKPKRKWALPEDY